MTTLLINRIPENPSVEEQGISLYTNPIETNSQNHGNVIEKIKNIIENFNEKNASFDFIDTEQTFDKDWHQKLLYKSKNEIQIKSF